MYIKIEIRRDLRFYTLLKPHLKKVRFFYDIIFKPLHAFIPIFVNHEEESHFDPVCIGIYLCCKS